MSRNMRWFILAVSLLGLCWSNQLAAAPQQQQTRDQKQAVIAAADWLITTRQNSDGGTTSFSTGTDVAPSDAGGTFDAILALASAGYDVRVLYPGKTATPVDFLATNGEAILAYAQTDGGAAGKVILGLLAAHQDPRAFAEQDFVANLTSLLTADGSYTITTPYQQALAILALSAAGETVSAEASQWLLDQQATDEGIAGSWDDGFGTTGNPDATALSLMALLAAGTAADDPAITSAVAFLASAQTDTSGWEYGPEFGANVNSTALVIQALMALGEEYANPDSVWSFDGLTPLDYLLQSQGESGAFQADFGSGRFDDFYATVQVLPALAGQRWPLQSHTVAAQQALSCLQTLQDPTTGGWENFAGFGVDAGGTSRAIQAIAAAGDDPTSERWTVNGINAVQALENLTPDYLATGRGGRVGTIMQGVAAASGNVNNFAGLDLYLTLTDYYSDTGELDDTAFGVFSHNRAMIGAIEAGYGEDELSPAMNYLLAAGPEGDWGGPDANGLALQILGSFGYDVSATIDVIRTSQLPDGGWGFDVSNPNSTSEVVRGLIVAGANPFSPEWSVVVSGTLISPIEAVLATQGENGCWPNLYGPGDDPFATTDAILLLMAQPLVWDAAATVITPVDATTTTAETAPTAVPIPQPTATAEAYLAPTEEPPAPTDVPADYVPPATQPVPAATSSTDGSNPVRPTPTIMVETSTETANAGSSVWVFVIALVAVVVGLGAYLTMRRK